MIALALNNIIRVQRVIVRVQRTIVRTLNNIILALKAIVRVQRAIVRVQRTIVLTLNNIILAPSCSFSNSPNRLLGYPTTNPSCTRIMRWV